MEKKGNKGTTRKKTKRIRGKMRYVKKLDKIFSEYIRLKNADRNGMVRCYTCGKRDYWKNMQCGHFFSRARMKTRWKERNCEVQCYRCNVALNGNYIVYTRKKLKEWGDELFEKREKESKELAKWSIEDLEKMIEEYKEKVKQLKKEKGLD